MAQQEKTMAKETYYVTQEKLDLIEDLKHHSLPFFNLVNSATSKMRFLSQNISDDLDKPILRYLGGDTSIEFKVKEQLYRLWRIDDDGERVYMKLGIAGTPTYTPHENSAFTATREEIEKNKTVSWDIEKAD